MLSFMIMLLTAVGFIALGVLCAEKDNRVPNWLHSILYWMVALVLIAHMAFGGLLGQG